PGLIMWRTKRGLKFIDRVAKGHRRSWLTFGTMAAVVGTALMVFIFSMMVYNLIFILSRPQPAEAPAGVAIALPGLVPGLTVITWLIAIGALVIVHEFSHGFVLRAQNLETKSVGGLLLLAIPGAFVEPNEKQLKKAPISKRLRVYGAGSFANILLALLCFGILLLLVAPKPGIYINDTIENYPAEDVLEPGTRILEIDNIPMKTYNVFSYFMDNTKPGQTIELSTDKGDFPVELAEDPDNENSGFLGVEVLSTTAISRSKFVNPAFILAAAMSEIWGRPVFHPHVYSSLVPWAIIDIIKWMFVLNLLISLFNLLPAVPLDGGYILRGVVERGSSKKTAKHVSYAFSIIVLALIAINFVPLVL
ncbi:MAG: site-2 protease family protein, partial [Candidatus Hadarchaeota archaeon]|nr:site-2 protease family protein [Candidatus Hadarchaeota archaeon]